MVEAAAALLPPSLPACAHDSSRCLTCPHTLHTKHLHASAGFRLDGVFGGMVGDCTQRAKRGTYLTPIHCSVNDLCYCINLALVYMLITNRRRRGRRRQLVCVMPRSVRLAIWWRLKCRCPMMR